ncbi:MAG: efflux RND transporter periplasmic adaptor subunit, partial [Actinomycetota bacterium]|nr:efflux RND transporter periplasmic adaptor subunit [Actinomycetota bacterium]
MQVFRNRRWAVGAAALALVAVLGVAGVMISRAFAATPGVATATAARKNLSATVSVSGKTEADVKRDVFPQAAGTLKEIAVVDGQEVKAGQQLATLDAEQLDAAVEAAESGHAQAVAQVDAAESAGPSSADRDAAAAQVTAAKRANDRAKSAVARAQAAVEATSGAAKSAAKGQLDAAKSAKEQANAAYLSASAARRKLSSSSTDAALKAARTAQRGAKSALARAKEARGNAVLTAPIDGVVVFNPVAAPGADGSAQKVTEGASVSPAAAPFTVVDLHTLKFTAQLDESDVPRVKTGSAAVVELDATPGREYSAKVDCVRPTAMQTSSGGNAFPATMLLENADGALRIGMGGSANITVADVKDAIAVPIEALVEDKDGKSSVFVVVSGRLAKREVTTGVMSETEVQIAKGLKAGEVVALSSGTPLEVGMQVKT